MGIRLFALFIFSFSLRIFSQDTIRFRDGVIIGVKVTEVGTNEIKYYRSDATDGPLRTSTKNAISWIKYKDGYVDSIPKEYVPENKPISRKLIIGGTSLWYCERQINDRQFLSMINETKDLTNRQALQFEFNLLRNYSTNYNNFGGLAGISFIGATIYPLFLYGLGLPSAAGVAVLVMAPVSICFTTFAVISHRKYKMQRVKTAHLYNNFN